MRIEIACKYCGTTFEAAPWRERQYCSRSCASRKARWSFHGLTNTPEHRVWRRIRRRCYSPQYHCYARYGGRGIKVCERWEDFNNFLTDMGPRPSPKHTVERIDNDGDYEPSNCKWATMDEQNKNKSNTYTPEQDSKIAEAMAKGYSYRKTAEYVGKSVGSVTARIHRLRLQQPDSFQFVGTPRGQMSNLDKPWVRNGCGLWCPKCMAHVAAPLGFACSTPPDVCSSCGYPDAEEDYRQCPRCNRQPADPVLLGSDEEGHICGACWSEDRHADSSGGRNSGT